MNYLFVSGSNGRDGSARFTMQMPCEYSIGPVPGVGPLWLHYPFRVWLTVHVNVRLGNPERGNIELGTVHRDDGGAP